MQRRKGQRRGAEFLKDRLSLTSKARKRNDKPSNNNSAFSASLREFFYIDFAAGRSSKYANPAVNKNAMIVPKPKCPANIIPN